jgi:hypothetical protein
MEGTGDDGSVSDVEERLRERIRRLEEENARLRSQLFDERKALPRRTDDGEDASDPQRDGDKTNGRSTLPGHGPPQASFAGVLDPDQIERYSRQLLVRGGFGVDGQIKLLNSTVLVVGAGGIGSTGRLPLCKTAHDRDADLRL